MGLLGGIRRCRWCIGVWHGAPRGCQGALGVASGLGA